MAEAPIPTYSNLKDVYAEGSITVDQLQSLPNMHPPGDQEAHNRIVALHDAFVKRFGSKPDVLARSPGRVNIIGEHIDYEGYGVLPMAIAQDTVVAIRKAGDALIITNLRANKYPDVQFAVDPSQPIDTDHHTWANYFLAAYKGAFEFLKAKGVPVPTPVGLQVMLHGLVPTGSGLSSSAAFTCSTAIALLALFDVSLTKGEVAEFTCTCERYVGTESGGMDQAISVMGLPGTALKVDFDPIRAAPVSLPPSACFVVANSLTVSNKAETGPQNYNMRVVECRLAAIVLAIALGQAPAEARAIRTLKQLEPRIAETLGGPKGEVGPEALVGVVREHLHEQPYSQEEVEGIIGQPLDKLLEGNASQLRVLAVAAQRGGFKLRQRAEHVYSEAARPDQFAAVCARGGDVQQTLAELGRLMDESQASCRDLYECSCEELDQLVSVAKGAGALGARLTGAGWGGCTVSLVPEGAVDGFIKALVDGYYAPLIAAGRLAREALPETVFATKPACGGGVLSLQL